MVFRIYPKLNIFLKIIGYQDGYHQINSRFVKAYGEIYDEMEIKAHSHFVLKGNFNCAMEDNLIFKAKCAMQKFLSTQEKKVQDLESLHIEVQKAIPQGAGLGGGSANAGVFLRAVNEFLALGLKEGELMQIAQSVGSDVSFFASGAASANVRGRGEDIESFVESPLNYDIYTPNIFCDTAKVYQRYASAIKSQGITYSTPTNEYFKLTSKELLDRGETKEVMNDLFVSATFIYPMLKDIARELGDKWYFSGSGSSFFKLKGIKCSKK